jgi:hypothetical protein
VRAGEPDPAGDERYRVEVSGGRGAVIGDYATVIQVFAQAPAPLSARIRTREFATLLAERTRDFIGREFVLGAIRDALVDPEFTSGYLVLQGEPGIGKTAVLAQMVLERGCVHHFNVAPLGIRAPQTFLANVCAQLIVRYGLGYRQLPAEATTDGGFLSRLLAEAAAVAEHHPIVIAVDALDEADDTGLPPGANRLFLPPDLPAGVYIVASSRPQTDQRLFTSSRRDIHLRDNDPRNLADIERYVRGYITAHEERMRLRLGEWAINEDTFAATVTERSAGNFMYVVHVLRDIVRGLLNASTVDDVRRLPLGLRQYYQRHWRDMRDADQDRFRRYQEPVICLLATAREPVSIPQLVDWTRRYWAQREWDQRHLMPLAVSDVLATWREFLDEDESGPDPRYRLYHASFQDFLADEVGLTAFHSTIGEAALAKIPGFLAEAPPRADCRPA